MLDTISYSIVNGIITKTVTSVSTVTDKAAEISALEAQITDFNLGEVTGDIAAAIANYQQQIAILQAD